MPPVRPPVPLAMVSGERACEFVNGAILEAGVLSAHAEQVLLNPPRFHAQVASAPALRRCEGARLLHRGEEDGLAGDAVDVLTAAPYLACEPAEARSTFLRARRGGHL